MVPSFRLWCWAKATRSGKRAMVPSSFMISQMTAAGVRPALRAISTDASVWPALTKVPPSRASSGNTWPGVVMLSAASGRVDRHRLFGRGRRRRYRWLRLRALQ